MLTIQGANTFNAENVWQDILRWWLVKQKEKLVQT